MDNLLTQLGVGGILAVLLVREVLGFLGRKRNGATSGDQPIDYWRQTIRGEIDAALLQSIVPVMKTQTDILARIEARTAQLYDGQVKAEYELGDISKSLERLRATQHILVDRLHVKDVPR